MQIKISEMLDQSTDYLEDSEYCINVDYNKIKKTVMNHLHHKKVSKPWFFYMRTAAAIFAVALTVTGTAVIAKGVLPAAGKITSENKTEISQKAYAHSYTEESSTDTETAAVSLNTAVLPGTTAFNPYQDLDTTRQCVISCKKKLSTYIADDFYLGNGYYARLKPDENDTLALEKGQKICINLTQRASSSDFSPLSYIGAWCNDTYTEIGKLTEGNASIVFEVPETGNYEFSVTNLSSERTFYTNTTICLESSAEKE